MFIIITMVVVIINLSRQIDALEDLTENQLIFIEKARDQTMLTLEVMRNLDSREMFEKDEDVGMIFESLLRAIEEYAIFMGDYGEVEDEEVVQTVLYKGH